LDEATSSVDTRTEIQIQEAFRRLMHGRTSFVIAHRLSTIRRADKVLVIDDGEIIERGTHGELMEKKGFYYRVYMSQFKGTNGGDLEPIRLTPAEIQAPRTPQGGPPMMGHGPMASGGHARMMEIVDTFMKNGATSPESAMALEELGLPPMFAMMLQGPMGQSGLILEHQGRYYISQERLEQMRRRFGDS
jgi:ABC-type multidrug transport system ATPase subunit